MCRTVSCKQCGKKTWAGCGQHVEQALRGVAPADRCAGHTKDESASGEVSRWWQRGRS